MAQHPNSGNTKKTAQQKTGKNSGKQQRTIAPDPAQTRKTGPSGLHNLTAEPGTTQD